ncbi:hypothetical protein Hamer_G010419, partial [Homarus americanus]
ISSADFSSSEEGEDVDFNVADSSKSPHFPNQHELDDLFRDLGLTKENAELGLVKQFIKVLSPESNAFKHVRLMFPKLSEAKVKGCIFIGPQIRQMLASKDLEDKMSTV